jgi:hypothetical protein
VAASAVVAVRPAAPASPASSSPAQNAAAGPPASVADPAAPGAQHEHKAEQAAPQRASNPNDLGSRLRDAAVSGTLAIWTAITEKVGGFFDGLGRFLQWLLRTFTRG